MGGAGTGDKSFANLQAQFARAGHQLHRTNAEDGQVRYFSTRWGLVRELGNLDEARAFLAQIQIGGAQ
ncbi:hypothetical protein DES41_11393 [Pseudorhodoferax soli]|uniref:Uncharacterized protein n=2 Tax=Pseudorhodoferax soli TaxID=545864 RepID=A0A368XBS6_9BURK|nr:hypothetical protein DES41_11393 [Pseudorhodoferax soli]